MYNFFSKRLNGNRKGFTLVELLVVIAIIAILIAIAVLNMGSANKSAKVNTHNANIREIMSAAALYMAEHPTDNIASAALSGTHPLLKYFKNGAPAPMYMGTGGSGTVMTPATSTDTFTVGLQDGEVTITPPEAKLDGDEVKIK